MAAARRSRITERRAALAARQLLYHRERMRWMEQRMEENETTLEGYLIGSGQDRAVLLGGYVVERTLELNPLEWSPENPAQRTLEVSEPIAGAEYEQLELLDREEEARR